MNTLEELEKLLEAATQGVLSTEGDGTTIIIEPGDETRFPIAQTYRTRDAALFSAAINALPGLIESARRAERLEAALQEIADRHVPDQPAAYDVPREDYLAAQYSTMRAIARVALKETP
jgi:hypothetical protein